VLEYALKVDTTSRNWRFYVQAYNNDNTITADQLFVEADYISSYDDDTEYTIATVKSTNTVVARSSTTDWSQYIETGTITPATSGILRLRIKISYYDSDAEIFIDPKPYNP